MFNKFKDTRSAVPMAMGLIFFLIFLALVYIHPFSGFTLYLQVITVTFICINIFRKNIAYVSLYGWLSLPLFPFLSFSQTAFGATFLMLLVIVLITSSFVEQHTLRFYKLVLGSVQQKDMEKLVQDISTEMLKTYGHPTYPYTLEARLFKLTKKAPDFIYKAKPNFEIHPLEKPEVIGKVRSHARKLFKAKTGYRLIETSAANFKLQESAHDVIRRLKQI